MASAHEALHEAAAKCGISDIEPLSDPALVRVLWLLVPPKPVESSHPLFILYTSGSTGKPKGIVHTHGGFQIGICATSSIALGISQHSSASRRNGPRDVLLVVATPGWITGQAYMISAALLTQTPSVLLDGSPVSPLDRFAAIIARHRVSVLKAGSTFLRMLMTHSEPQRMLARHDMTSLRIGTFCAEPVRRRPFLARPSRSAPTRPRCCMGPPVSPGQCHCPRVRHASLDIGIHQFVLGY